MQQSKSCFPFLHAKQLLGGAAEDEFVFTVEEEVASLGPYPLCFTAEEKDFFWFPFPPPGSPLGLGFEVAATSAPVAAISAEVAATLEFLAPLLPDPSLDDGAGASDSPALHIRILLDFLR